jgi:hypothetical protein
MDFFAKPLNVLEIMDLFSRFSTRSLDREFSGGQTVPPKHTPGWCVLSSELLPA